MLEHYLDEIGREPLLTAEEEALLARRVQCGDRKARDRMIKGNLRLVVKIAAEFSDRGVPLSDLVSEGNIGLIKAVDRFRPDTGAKFSTYASWWVREAVHRCICSQARVVRLPHQLVSKISKLRRAAGLLSVELGREPDVAELAEELGLPVASVTRWESAARSSMSLDEPLGEEGLSLAATLRDEGAAPADEVVFDNEARFHALSLLDALGTRERRVVERRFGLSGTERSTLEDISNELGCTRERVRQIQDAALRKMRREWQRRESRAALERPAA